jgi:predicted nucleic acid-binding protein
MGHRLIWKKLVLPLALVLLVSATIFAALYKRADKDNRAALEVEAGKAMLQVIAAVLVGNIVLVIVRDFEERRKAWITKRDLLRADLTDGLQALYSRAKGARRLLRANVGLENTIIATKKYDELLQEVSDVQLGLERYKRQAESGVKTLLLPASLFRELESMEKYLGRLVKEYESVLRSSDDSIPLANLPRLRDFIGRYGESEFRSAFAQPYDTAARTVAEQIDKDLPGGAS